MAAARYGARVVRWRLRRLSVLVAVAIVVAGGIVVFGRAAATTPGAALGAAGQRLVATTRPPRDLDAYRGLGAWVDAFDYAPAYQPAGGAPSIDPGAVDDMATHGVRTLFLQVARNDARSPGGIVDRALLGQFLVRAHRHGMRVVGWYLPKFGDVAVDRNNIDAMATFETLGHRLDGIAVDIEFTEDVPDPELRNQRLIELSTGLRGEMGADAIAAIVLPPVLTEVVNPDLWPSFPWRDLAPLYDAWLPMSYWTFRSGASGYHDGYVYNEESTRRLRANLGDGDAVVHGIGGIGDLMTIAELDAFAQSLVDTAAVGGSIYDWNTMGTEAKAELERRFGIGVLAGLAPP